ncbi:MAG: 6-phosphogluconolactonase [Desulfobulbaceae bacterium]|nr:6-phosphogluconolactonase [Desulfobulbaceae bacterium]
MENPSTKLKERIKLFSFSSPEETASALADHIGDLLGAALAQHGETSMAVSGGSTPKPLFRALAKKSLAWQHIHITLVDERWVNPDHPDSNEKLVRDHLLRDEASAAHFVGLKNSHPTAALGRAVTEQNVAAMPHPFEVVILGMGSDGHTASFFPGAPELARALDIRSPFLCESVTPPKAPLDRITITLPVLLQAHHRILHITGQEKLEVLAKALELQNAEHMPIYALFRFSPAPVVYWCS